MVALQPLGQQSWAGKLPNIAANEPFWASSRDSPGLIAAGLARLWQSGDPPAPPAEPAWTAHGTPGFGAGTSNSSYPAAALAAMIDGGTAAGPAVAVIDGGPAASGSPAGLIDGGRAR